MPRQAGQPAGQQALRARPTFSRSKPRATAMRLHSSACRFTSYSPLSQASAGVERGGGEGRGWLHQGSKAGLRPRTAAATRRRQRAGAGRRLDGRGGRRTRGRLAARAQVGQQRHQALLDLRRARGSGGGRGGVREGECRRGRAGRRRGAACPDAQAQLHLHGPSEPRPRRDHAQPQAGRRTWPKISSSRAAVMPWAAAAAGRAAAGGGR